MAQFHDAPAYYLEAMRQALPLYDRMQEAVAEAVAGLSVSRMLDLGIGTGETSRRCLDVHPGAELVGIDASAEMLEIAALTVGEDADLRCRSLEDPLPAGPFDLVVSALAIHHLEGEMKADLFRRVRGCLARGGCFVMADVVVPDVPAAQPTPLDPSVDRPERPVDLIAWMTRVGFRVKPIWSEADLIVLVGR